jgi:signal transduction histidine kinase
MTLIHTAQPASPLDKQRIRREVLLLQPYISQPQSRFRARIRALVTADRQKDESLAILLHELRSPLASIQNAVAALRTGSKNETFQKHMHELIERQVHQIGRLTSSLCQLRGSTLEDLQIQRERIDLCSVLASAAETVTPDITQQQHHLVLGLPETSIWILGDAGRLEEVFVNLLSNASKYSDVGGRITMSMHVSDLHAVVHVRDSGIGIAADSLPYIFELFVRADTMAVRARAGLGIGLALVRSIVDSHGGTVSAASAGIGHGSSFTVRLPLES